MEEEKEKLRITSGASISSYYGVWVSANDMPWPYIIKTAVVYLLQPVLLPILLIASKALGRTMKW